jgi:hypothetical protein
VGELPVWLGSRESFPLSSNVPISISRCFDILASASSSATELVPYPHMGGSVDKDIAALECGLELGICHPPH